MSYQSILPSVEEANSFKQKIAKKFGAFERIDDFLMLRLLSMLPGNSGVYAISGKELFKYSFQRQKTCELSMVYICSPSFQMDLKGEQINIYFRKDYKMTFDVKGNALLKDLNNFCLDWENGLYLVLKIIFNGWPLKHLSTDLIEIF